MPLPAVHMPDKRHWETLHAQAETPDAKAIIGALMLVVSEIRSLPDMMPQASDGQQNRGEP